MSLLLAQYGQTIRACECPLSGVKPTYFGHRGLSAFDLTRTSGIDINKYCFGVRAAALKMSPAGPTAAGIAAAPIFGLVPGTVPSEQR
jgi:hypothetical protein